MPVELLDLTPHHIVVKSCTVVPPLMSKQFICGMERSFPGYRVTFHHGPRMSDYYMEISLQPRSVDPHVAWHRVLHGPTDYTTVLDDLRVQTKQLPPPNLFVRVVGIDQVTPRNGIPVNTYVVLELGRMLFRTPTVEKSRDPSWAAKDATFALTLGGLEDGPEYLPVRVQIWDETTNTCRSEVTLRPEVLPENIQEEVTQPLLWPTHSGALKLIVFRCGDRPGPAHPYYPVNPLLLRSVNLQFAAGRIVDEEDARVLFSHFDRDKSGTMTKGEFMEMFEQLDHVGRKSLMEEMWKTTAHTATVRTRTAVSDVERLLQKHNFLGDGVLSFDEFSLVLTTLTQQ